MPLNGSDPFEKPKQQQRLEQAVDVIVDDIIVAAEDEEQAKYLVDTGEPDKKNKRIEFLPDIIKAENTEQAPNQNAESEYIA